MSPAPRRPHALAALAVGVGAVHWMVLKDTSTWSPPASAGSPVQALQVRTLLPAPAARPAAPAAASANLTRTAAPPAVPTPASRAAPGAPATTAQAAGAVAASATSAPLAVAVPAPATLHYVASARTRGVELTGGATLDWSHDGSSYQARLNVRLADQPARVQRSMGTIGPAGLAPQRFSDHTRSEEAAHFDRDAQRIVFSTNRPAAVLEAGAQDRVSVLWQVPAIVAGAPDRFTVGHSIRLQTAGTREADAWLFILEAQEPVALPSTTVPAMRWVRRPSRPYEPLLELWLGPGPTYAPVRLRLTHPGGDWLDLQWSGTDKG